MRRFVNGLSCIGLFAAALASSSAMAAPTKPQERLDATLSGYSAGKPQSCISQYSIDSVDVFDGIGLLYKTSSNRYYLNIPTSGASALDDQDVLVTDNWSSQLCSIDTVRLWDPLSRMTTGFVNLGPFIPYTKTN